LHFQLVFDGGFIASIFHEMEHRKQASPRNRFFGIFFSCSVSLCVH
jgi:hypothetical protein